MEVGIVAAVLMTALARQACAGGLAPHQHGRAEGGAAEFDQIGLARVSGGPKTFGRLGAQIAGNIAAPCEPAHGPKRRITAGRRPDQDGQTSGYKS